MPAEELPPARSKRAAQRGAKGLYVDFPDAYVAELEAYAKKIDRSIGPALAIAAVEGLIEIKRRGEAKA